MNEPTWGFAVQTPAEGMLGCTQTACTRAELARHLTRKYRDDERETTGPEKSEKQQKGRAPVGGTVYKGSI